MCSLSRHAEPLTWMHGKTRTSSTAIGREKAVYIRPLTIAESSYLFKKTSILLLKVWCISTDCKYTDNAPYW